MKQIMESDEASSDFTIGNIFHFDLQQQQDREHQLQRQHEQLVQYSNNKTLAVIVSPNDVCMGDLVASGSFASVYKVSLNGSVAHSPNTIHRSMPATGPLDVDMIDDLLLGEPYEYTERMITSSRHSYNSVTASSQKPYALKRLNDVILNTPAKVNHGLKGMIFEAQLLSHILPQQHPHPNIVRMYGMSPNFMNDPINGFLILEFLVETLDHRLQRWMNRQTMMMNEKAHHHHVKEHHSTMFLESCQRLFDTHSSNRKSITLKEQLTRTKYIGYGIANAIKYLHEHHVLYRDLKPSNVGFDERGTVKLFDFDLSRQYYDVDVTNGTKHLTSCIGSLRYMSPECAQGKPYGFSSDVHSYAILLWEICALQRPYVNVHTTSALVKVAFFGNERPSLRKIASPQIKQVLQKGWNPNPNVRPTMPSIVDTLRSLHRPCNSSGCNSGVSPTTLRRLMSRRQSG
jgi:serine/threonine protein kinase